MSTENTIDKVKLISELKEIHSELFQVYKRLFDFKYKHDEEFKVFIDTEHKENGVGSKDKKAWNDNFCHRASYTLLNKILFVRICEDKGFMRNSEDYIAGEVKDPHIGEKLSKTGVQKWNKLVTNYTFGELIKFAFKDMKKSYSNISLYKEDKYEILNPRDEEFSLKYIDGDKDTKDLVLDFEKVLNNIIEKLDTNNFNFKYTDGNILGDVYEKFMDRETRKAIGQFYTPEFVIKYILKNTVEEVDVVENPFVTVADISCGSGHFLIMAYDILKEKFLSNLEELKEKYAEEVYTIKKNGKEEQLTGREYWVKEHIHYHILKHCIYGADIDSFAVQLTTINLLLKDLDNFTDELNVIECDSLIKWEEDYDWKNLREQLEEEFETVVITQTNLFGEGERIEQIVRKENYKLRHKDISGIEIEELINREKADEILELCKFWSNKFDYIVGNPPYVSLSRKHGHKIREELRIYYINRYQGNMYSPNLFEYFIKRGLNCLNSKGYFSLIIPDRLGKNVQYSDLRYKILKNYYLKRLVYNIDFPDIITDTMIFVLQNANDIKDNIIEIDILEKRRYQIIQNKYLDNPNHEFSYNESNLNEIIKNRIETISVPLGNISDTFTGFIGISKLIHKTKEKYDEIEMYKGENISKYICKSNYYYSFVPENIKGGTNDKKKLQYHTKILVRKTGSSIIAAFDDKGYIIEQSLYGIINLKLEYRYKFILAILNSRLISWYYRNFLVTNIDSTPQIKKYHLDMIPIAKCDLSIQDKICDLVDELIKDFRKINDGKFDYSLDENEIYNQFIIRERLKFNIEKKLNTLDDLILEIYGIDDVKIVDLIKGYDSNHKVEKVHNIDTFIRLHKIENKSIEKISEITGIPPLYLYDIRENLASQLDRQSLLQIYNLTELCDSILQYMGQMILKRLDAFGKSVSLTMLKEVLIEQIENFNNLLTILRDNKCVQNSFSMIKNSLNSNAYTWNAYRKDKIQNKVKKPFVKYYDNNYYGLSEWSDEIHKKYFMDAIEEYTVKNPNEKKASDILKLFTDLGIEDKQEYVDVIEDKIKRAFNKEVKR